MAILDRALSRLLPAVPKPLVQRISRRYIAGAACSDAMRVVRELNAQGKTATVDVLGEEITSAEEAAAITRAYLDVLDMIDAAGGPDEQVIALRDAMRVLFPEAVALVSAARQGFMREQ